MFRRIVPPSGLVPSIALLFIALVTACGGNGGSAQETPATATTGVSPGSGALNQEIAELQALVDENVAKIEATTDKQELAQVLTGFTNALIAAEARLRRLDVPPEHANELDALLGVISHVEGSIGGDAQARLASGSVEEAKEFIERYARIADLRAAISALRAR